MQKPNASIEVAIVILNYNGIIHLKQFMPIIHELNSAPYKVIIIDNASEDNSVSYLKSHYADIDLILLDRNYGFAEGYNKGLQRIKAEYYLILNNDISIQRKDVDILHRYLRKNPHYVVAQPKIRSYDEKQKFEYAGASGGFIDALGYPFCRGRVFDFIEDDTGQYNDNIDIFWASGAAMLIKASVFHSLGGFEEYFFAHQEEIDLCWRIRRAGMGIKCLPAAVAYHKGGGTLNYDNPFKTYLNFRNNLLTILRNNNGLRLIWLFPLRLILDWLALVQFLLKGKGKLALSVIKARLSIYRHLKLHLKKRKVVSQKVKTASTKHSPDYAGLVSKSLIFQYYLLGKRTFKEIMQ